MLLCALLGALSLAESARADLLSDLIPDRRRDYYAREPNQYLVIPAVASLPGFGVFVGVLGSGSNLGGTGANIGVGLAESISGSDIHIEAIALQEIPIWDHIFTFDYQYADLTLGNYQAYVPGRDSPNFTYPVTQSFNFQLVRPTLRFWERRITLAYTLSFSTGFNVDQNGNQVSSSNYGSNGSLQLDFTDDVVSPTKGERFNYQTSLTAPTSSIFGKASGNSGSLLGSGRGRVRSEQYQFTDYWLAADRWDLVTDLEFFQALGDSGQTVVTGGSLPLRGYPGNRWSDRYGVFGALELRYTIPINRRLSIPFLASGLVDGWQLATFYEQGQVSPNKDGSLFTSMHSDYGAGVRLLLQAVVVRFDVARSDEGTQTALTIDEPF